MPENTINNIKTLTELLGNPSDIDQELKSFKKAAQVLSAKHPRMIDRYPKQWVAVHEGRVIAHAKTLRSVLTQSDKKGAPRGQLILRFIDKQRRAMIL